MFLAKSCTSVVTIICVTKQKRTSCCAQRFVFFILLKNCRVISVLDKADHSSVFLAHVKRYHPIASDPVAALFRVIYSPLVHIDRKISL